MDDKRYFQLLHDSADLIKDRGPEPDIGFEWTEEDWERYRANEIEIQRAMYGRQKPKE